MPFNAWDVRVGTVNTDTNNGDGYDYGDPGAEAIFHLDARCMQMQCREPAR
jgi:hypothetical protein